MNTQFVLTSVQISEVNSIILSIKENKSPIAIFPNKILKFIGNLVSLLLATILNRSLNTGCFPNTLESAGVMTILKAGERSNLNNYRPISIFLYSVKK